MSETVRSQLSNFLNKSQPKVIIRRKIDFHKTLSSCCRSDRKSWRYWKLGQRQGIQRQSSKDNTTFYQKPRKKVKRVFLDSINGPKRFQPVKIHNFQKKNIYLHHNQRDVLTNYEKCTEYNHHLSTYKNDLSHSPPVKQHKPTRSFFVVRAIKISALLLSIFF